MPRVTRGLADGMIYHVINRGNGRQDVFHKDEDFQAFVPLLKEAKAKHPVRLLGYCLIKLSRCQFGQDKSSNTSDGLIDYVAVMPQPLASVVW